MGTKLFLDHSVQDGSRCSLSKPRCNSLKKIFSNTYFYFYLIFVRSSPSPFVTVRRILVVRSNNEVIISAFIISLGRKFKNDYPLKIVFWTTLYEMVAAVHRWSLGATAFFLCSASYVFCHPKWNVALASLFV